MRFKLYSLILITIAFAFLSAKSSAQTKTEETLQIEVADTIELVPDKIIFAIAFMEDYEQEISNSKKPTKETIAQQVEKVKKIAAKYALDTLTEREAYLNDNLFGDYPLQLFTVSFASKDKIRLFMNEIGPKPKIKTFVYQLINYKTDFWDKELFQKVLNKAKKEAEFIATQTSKKITTIADLKTNYDSEQTGGWTSYPPLSMIANYKSINSKEKIILYKKITVKFNWQNN